MTLGRYHNEPARVWPSSIHKIAHGPGLRAGPFRPRVWDPGPRSRAAQVMIPEKWWDQRIMTAVLRPRQIVASRTAARQRMPGFVPRPSQGRVP
jgi:hypothetical protein